VISSSQRPLPDNTQHTQQTNIHGPGGIRTNDRSRQAAIDLRLRPRGLWDQRFRVQIAKLTSKVVFRLPRSTRIITVFMYAAAHSLLSWNSVVIPWLRPFVDGILFRKPGFDLRPFYVGFLWSKRQRDSFLPSIANFSCLGLFINTHRDLFIHHRRHIILETDVSLDEKQKLPQFIVSNLA
jgi:hypothetical protein